MTVVFGRATWASPLLLGFLGTLLPRWPAGHKEMVLLTANQICFVFFCFMTSASGKALAPHVWPKTWVMTLRAEGSELHSVAVT